MTNRTRVKVCGITNLEDASVAAAAGADLLGFIFYPKSPRGAEPKMAAKIVAKLRQAEMGANQRADGSELKFVAVFVNESVEWVRQIVEQTGVDYVQLHGNETAEMMDQLEGISYKALRSATTEEAQADATLFAPLGTVDGPRWMIDAHDPNLYGGTGKKADWHAAAELARQHPGLLLAGGITPENVADAIRTVQPWGVDVASGVEAEPGRKDHAKVQALLKAARDV